MNRFPGLPRGRNRTNKPILPGCIGARKRTTAGLVSPELCYFFLLHLFRSGGCFFFSTAELLSQSRLSERELIHESYIYAVTPQVTTTLSSSFLFFFVCVRVYILYIYMSVCARVCVGVTFCEMKLICFKSRPLNASERPHPRS